jgi:putative membrane protein
MKLSTLVMIAALGCSGAAMAADSSSAKGSGEKISAEDFVKKASAAGAAEVEMGKLGAAKATNPEVKAFAQKMVTDHTKANTELTAAASAKKLEIKSDPDLMHKGMKEKFEHQTADAEFNHDFMAQMVRDHEAVVELFTTAANDSTLDVDLRTWANKTLPTLKQHLASAQKLEAKVAKK